MSLQLSRDEHNVPLFQSVVKNNNNNNLKEPLKSGSVSCKIRFLIHVESPENQLYYAGKILFFEASTPCKVLFVMI